MMAFQLKAPNGTLETWNPTVPLPTPRDPEFNTHLQRWQRGEMMPYQINRGLNTAEYPNARPDWARITFRSHVGTTGALTLKDIFSLSREWHLDELAADDNPSPNVPTLWVAELERFANGVRIVHEHTLQRFYVESWSLKSKPGEDETEEIVIICARYKKTWSRLPNGTPGRVLDLDLSNDLPAGAV